MLDGHRRRQSRSKSRDKSREPARRNSSDSDKTKSLSSAEKAKRFVQVVLTTSHLSLWCT